MDTREAALTARIENIRYVWEPDDIAGGEDAYGCYAVAKVIFDTPQGGGIYGPAVCSAGLWGVELDDSPSSEAHRRQIEADQLEELRYMLHALGFSDAQIDATPVTEAGRRPGAGGTG